MDSIYNIRIAIAPKRREINLLILDVDNLLVPSLIFYLQTLPIKGCHNLGIERLNLRSDTLFIPRIQFENRSQDEEAHFEARQLFHSKVSM